MSQFFISPDFIFKSRHNVCSVHIAALVRICPMFSRNKQPRGRCARCDEEYLDYKRGQMTPLKLYEHSVLFSAAGGIVPKT